MYSFYLFPEYFLREESTIYMEHSMVALQVNLFSLSCDKYCINSKISVLFYTDIPGNYLILV